MLNFRSPFAGALTPAVGWRWAHVPLDPAHGRTLGTTDGRATIPVSNHDIRPQRKPAASAQRSRPHGRLRLGCARALGQYPAESRGFLRPCPSARGKSLQQQTGWRREWDSNPRYLSVHTLSKRAPSAARPSLRAARRGSPGSLTAGENGPPRNHGGEGGIRTLGRVAPTQV